MHRILAWVVIATILGMGGALAHRGLPGLGDASRSSAVSERAAADVSVSGSVGAGKAARQLAKEKGREATWPAALRAVAWPVGGIGVGALFIVAIRLRRRHCRVVCRYAVSLPRGDRPEFPRVVDLVAAWHRTLQRERGLTRLFFGQPQLGLEIHSAPRRALGPGLVVSEERETTFCVVLPPELAAPFDAHLAACYPNARLGHELAGAPASWEGPSRLPARMLRITRTGRSVLRAVRPPEKDEPWTCDALLPVMEQASGACALQLRLVPTSHLAEWRMRRRLVRFEQGIEARKHQLRPGPSLKDSPLLRAEVDGALTLQHGALFRTEVWLMADDKVALRALSATVLSRAGEARLSVRRAWAFYHRRRAGRALPSFFAHDVLAAREVAALWHLPTHRGTLERSPLPRLSLPAAVARSRADVAWVEASGVPVTLRVSERKLGVGIVGVPGAGKSSVMVRGILGDIMDNDAAVFGFDPKSDFIKQVLSRVPEGRRVWYLDLARPEFGYNPLEAPLSPGVIAETIIDALRDIHDDGAIQASSERYLKYAIIGAIVLARDLSVRPTMRIAATLLRPKAANFHRKVAELCSQDPELQDVADFFGRDLPEQLEVASSQTTAKLDAPLNKLQSAMLSATASAVLNHPVQLHLDEILERREVLLVDGSMGTVGATTASRLIQIMLRGLFGALQRQQEKLQQDRARVCVWLDESHFILNATFARMAATGRSAGLELVCAWQMGAQFHADREVSGALDTLLQQRFVFRCGIDDARDAVRSLLPAYVDSLRDDARLRELQRVLPDTLTSLPDHHAVVSLIAKGRRQDPFIARTYPATVEGDAVETHLKRQREWELRGQKPHPDPELPHDIPEIESLERRAPRPGRGPQANGTEETLAAAVRLAPEDVPEGDQMPAGEDGQPGTQGAERHETEAPPSLVSEDATTAQGPKRSSEAEAVVCEDPAEDAVQEAPRSEQAPREDKAPGAEENVPQDTEPAAEPPGEVDASPAENATPVEVVPVTGGPGGQECEESSGPGADAGDEPSVGTSSRGPDALAVGMPESYMELEAFEQATRYTIDELGIDEKERAKDPRRRDLEVLRLLYKARFALPGQIAREVYPDRDRRTAQRELLALCRRGWLKRFRTAGAGGNLPSIYAATNAGFTAARRFVETAQPGIRVPEERWQEPVIAVNKETGEASVDPRHEIRAAGWVLAFKKLLGQGVVRAWHGPTAPVCHLKVPVTGRGERRGPMSADRVNLPYPHQARGLGAFRNINADAVIEVLGFARDGGARERFDLFVEFDRTQRRDKNAGKLADYDAFITAWSRNISRYDKDGVNPAVVFVLRDERVAKTLARHADRILTGAITRPGKEDGEWYYPGRKAVFFASEPDIHLGKLRAFQVPHLPPGVREERHLVLLEVDLVNPRLLSWSGGQA
jgi:Replication-relaxation